MLLAGDLSVEVEDLGQEGPAMVGRVAVMAALGLDHRLRLEARHELVLLRGRDDAVQLCHVDAHRHLARHQPVGLVVAEPVHAQQRAVLAEDGHRAAPKTRSARISGRRLMQVRIQVCVAYSTSR